MPVNNPVDLSQYNFSQSVTPGKRKKKVQQPWRKWSWDGKDLLIWPVDEEYGQPHHIEMTGKEFYLLAQGRVYVDPNGHIEILVWEDRGTPEMQDDAVNAVDQYIYEHFGKIADDVEWQSEGGYYQTIDPAVGPDEEKLMSTYFGYPVKPKPQSVDEASNLDAEFAQMAQDEFKKSAFDPDLLWIEIDPHSVIN
jgi:hypothetical protein